MVKLKPSLPKITDAQMLAYCEAELRICIGGPLKPLASTLSFADGILMRVSHLETCGFFDEAAASGLPDARLKEFADLGAELRTLEATARARGISLQGGLLSAAEAEAAARELAVAVEAELRERNRRAVLLEKIREAEAQLATVEKQLKEFERGF